MLSVEEDRQIREICHDMNVQIASPHPPAIIMQIYVPQEDLQILETHRTQIIRSFINNGIDSPYAHAAAYLMTYVAFECFDRAYWKHLSDYVSFDILPNLRQTLGKEFYAYAENHGFHTIDDGNKYVGTLLFNTGIPQNYAQRFFNTAKSLYERIHGNLSEDNLKHLKMVVEDMGFSYASAGGQARGVREFMADLEYSSDLWKGVLTRIDQTEITTDEGLLQDLGVLEESFKNWSSSSEAKIRSDHKTRETGLYLNTKDLKPYVHLSQMTVTGRNPQMSINGEDPITIGVKISDNQFVTIPYDQNLDDEEILSGFKITLDGEVVFTLQESKFIVFNKAGIPSQNLTRGTNYILCEQDQEIEDYSCLNYFGDYAIYTLEDLENGDVRTICGSNISVGFKQSHDVRWIVDEADVHIKHNSEHISCLRSHPMIHIDSDMSECILYVYDNDGLVLKTHILQDKYPEFDTASIIPTAEGYYRLIVRFGSIKFRMSYALISDLEIMSSELVTSSANNLSVTLWGRTKEIPVSSEDFYKEFDITRDGNYRIRLRTNIIGYSFDRSPVLKQLGNTIKRHEIRESLLISTGMMKNGFLELNVYSKGEKLTGTRYLKINGGKASVSLGNLMYSLRNIFDEMTFEIKTNNRTMNLFTVRAEYGIDVDELDGICLLTSKYVPFGRKAICRGTADDKPFEFELKSGTIKDIIYSDRLDLTIVDSRSGETIRAPITRLCSNKGCKTKNKTLEEYASDKDYEGAFCEANWKIRKGQYKDALRYLSLCVRNQYSPAYEQYAFCVLNVENNDKIYKEYLAKASRSGSKRSLLLEDLIEQFKL